MYALWKSALSALGCNDAGRAILSDEDRVISWLGIRPRLFFKATAVRLGLGHQRGVGKAIRFLRRCVRTKRQVATFARALMPGRACFSRGVSNASPGVSRRAAKHDARTAEPLSGAPNGPREGARAPRSCGHRSRPSQGPSCGHAALTTASLRLRRLFENAASPGRHPVAAVCERRKRGLRESARRS